MTGKGDVSVLYPNHANDGDDGAAWFDDWENDNDRIFIATSREGWPHAIGRAIKAEAEVERLQTENALLRAELESFYYPRTALLKDLAELDKDKEGE